MDLPSLVQCGPDRLSPVSTERYSSTRLPESLRTGGYSGLVCGQVWIPTLNYMLAWTDMSRIGGPFLPTYHGCNNCAVQWKRSAPTVMMLPSGGSWVFSLPELSAHHFHITNDLLRKITTSDLLSTIARCFLRAVSNIGN